MVEATLLPFEGHVLYDGFLKAANIGARAQKQLEDEFERRVSEGVVADAQTFAERSRRWAAKRSERDMERFLAGLQQDAQEGEGPLPEGFRRGALAGLSPEERTAARETHFAEADSDARRSIVEGYRKLAFHGNPELTLAQAVGRYRKSDLYGMLRGLSVPGLSKLKKAELVELFCSILLEEPDALVVSLIYASEEAFELMRRASRYPQEPFIHPLDEDSLAGRRVVVPCPPYAYLVQSKGRFFFAVPQEICELLSGLDWEEIADMRELILAEISVADACVTYCGVVAVQDAYVQLKQVCNPSVALPDFMNTLDGVSRGRNLSFQVWQHPSTEAYYLVYYTLTSEYVRDQLLGGLNAPPAGAPFGSNEDTSDFFAGGSDLEQMRHVVNEELDRLDQVLDDLIDAHARTPMPEQLVRPEMLERSAIGLLLELPAAQALRRYIDEHLPEEEDDYTFSDEIVEDIVLFILETGSVESSLEMLEEEGFAQSSKDPELLVNLVRTLYDNLPSWENNGWSPREITESLTGRTIFYDERGEQMHVGAFDPCPCGSGKPYGACHGR